MSWHQVTTDMVLQEFTPAEQATLKNIQAAQDNLQPILDRTVAAVRGAIRAGGYDLGADGQTPDQLDGEVIAITRWRYLVAIPQAKSMQTDARKAAHDSAVARIDKVANQEVNIETPTAGVNPASGNWNSENKLLMRTHPTPTAVSQGQQTDQNNPQYANPDITDQ